MLRSCDGIAPAVQRWMYYITEFSSRETHRSSTGGMVGKKNEKKTAVRNPIELDILNYESLESKSRLEFFWGLISVFFLKLLLQKFNDQR